MRKLALLASVLALAGCSEEGFQFGKSAETTDASASASEADANRDPTGTAAVEAQAESTVAPLPRPRISDVAAIFRWSQTRYAARIIGSAIPGLPVAEEENGVLEDFWLERNILGYSIVIGPQSASVFSGDYTSVDDCATRHPVENGSALLLQTHERLACIDLISIRPIEGSDSQVLTVRYNEKLSYFVPSELVVEYANKNKNES